MEVPGYDMTSSRPTSPFGGLTPTSARSTSPMLERAKVQDTKTDRKSNEEPVLRKSEPLLDLNEIWTRVESKVSLMLDRESRLDIYDNLKSSSLEPPAPDEEKPAPPTTPRTDRLFTLSKKEGKSEDVNMGVAIGLSEAKRSCLVVFGSRPSHKLLLRLNLTSFPFSF